MIPLPSGMAEVCFVLDFASPAGVPSNFPFPTGPVDHASHYMLYNDAPRFSGLTTYFLFSSKRYKLR